MKSSVYIITGTNRGLGEALVDEIISLKNYDRIISIGRKINAKQTRYLEAEPTRFYFIEIDLSDCVAITEKLDLHNITLHQADKLVFINNAGTISPIERIGSLKGKELILSIQVNATAPAILTNYILEQYNDKELTFVNITSGAAEKPVEGWAAYCSGKAYTKMFFAVLQKQTRNNSRIKTYQIDPGTMDTGMQNEIRSSDPNVFAKHGDFVDLKEHSKLKSAKETAVKILEQLERP